MAAALALPAIPEVVKLRIGHIACGMGGGALGFKWCKGTYMLGDTPVRYEWENVAGIDVNPVRIEQFKRITGAPGYVVDLFTRPMYIGFHSKLRDLEDKSLVPLLTRILIAYGSVKNRTQDMKDGLIRCRGRRYWKYGQTWYEVDKWCPPPPEWQECTPERLRQIFGEKPPHAFFHSLPCQGNSMLLPELTAAQLKYVILNGLVPHAIYLCMLAWPDDPVPLMFGENVPGIESRSAELLDDMERVSAGLGYRTNRGNHDAGVIGGLAQTRKRFFWIQVLRSMFGDNLHVAKPPKKGLRPIRDVIGPLPMPGDPKGGPLNRRQNLEFLTQLRLASIKPGGDWKDIPGPGEWRLMTFDGREVPPDQFDRKNPPDPQKWGRIFVMQLLPGAAHYPSIRIQHAPMGNGRGAYWVMKETTASGTLTSDPRPGKSGGASCVSDSRVHYNLQCPSKNGRHAAHLRVAKPGAEGGTVTGADHVANGAPSTADERLQLQLPFRETRHQNYEPQPIDSPARTQTTQTDVQTGAQCVADDRLQLQLPFRETRHASKSNVNDPDAPADTVTTSDRVGSGAPSVADMRVGVRFEHTFDVTGPDENSSAVAGGTGPSSGGVTTADERLGLRLNYSPRDNAQTVLDMDKVSPTVPGNASVNNGNGPGAAAHDAINIRLSRDPKNGTAEVLDLNGAAPTITPHTDVNGDAKSLADMRFTCHAKNQTMGVAPSDSHIPAVIGHLDVYAGVAAAEDRRMTVGASGDKRVVCTLEWNGPDPVTIASLMEDGEVVIHYWPDWFPPYFVISPWNAWHYALTELQLAALQGFPAFDPETNEPFWLEGSRKDVRAAIGNAVPPPAAEAIGHVLAPTLIVAMFIGPDAWIPGIAGKDIWVREQGDPLVPLTQ